MKRNALIAALVGMMLAGAVALPGCMAPSEQTKTDEHAAEHRTYMAQLGQRIDDLDEVLADFQTAVGSEDVVAMKAAVARASVIVEDVANKEAPEKLTEVKDSYTAGLEQLQQALESYTQLYADVAAGAVTQAEYDAQLLQAQTAYDAGVEAVKAADEKAVALANE